jgi:signal transduction histidine kinase
MLAFAAGLLVGAALSAAVVRRLARRREAILGRLFSFAGHELNSPLTAVTMTVSNLAGGVFGSSPEEQRPWLELLREQVSRLGHLVGEMRDFTHSELKGGLVVIPEALPAAQIVQDAMRSVRSGLAQAKIPFEETVPSDLPDIFADPDKAARTLVSLIYHARKFRASGPIRLALRQEGGFIVFELTFVGHPTPAAEIRQTLELLYPGLAERQTLKAIGLGLGLQRLVLERQGGGLAYSVDAARHILEMRLPVVQKKR